MTTRSDNTSLWYASYDEVVRFGRDLLRGGMFDVPFLSPGAREAADNMLNFFEKPWHWNREYLWWVANDWPDNDEIWERGRDTEWEIM